MPRQFTTKRADGEYSTLELPNGVVETVWFPKDTSWPSLFVGRTFNNIAAIAEEHIKEYENAF